MMTRLKKASSHRRPSCPWTARHPDVTAGPGRSQRKPYEISAVNLPFSQWSHMTGCNFLDYYSVLADIWPIATPEPFWGENRKTGIRLSVTVKTMVAVDCALW
jgi:hypothetical protein